MGASPGVFRPRYRGADGEVREADSWAIAYWDAAAGKRRKEYGFKSAGEAKRARADRMGAKVRGPADVSLSDLVALVVSDYELHGRRSIVQAKAKAALLVESLGAGRLARFLDTAAVESHVRRLQGQGYAPATINRTLAVLKRGFRLGVRKWPGLVVPHIPMLSEVAAIRQGWLEGDELARIMAHLSPAARPIVEALHITGWRVGEMLSRRWFDVEGGALMLRPGETKNGRGRAYPLEPDLKKVLDALPRGAPEARIFAIQPGGLRSAWDRARVAAGLPHRLMHDLRRTAARDLIRAGVDRDTARRLLGHETDSIFSRYRIVAGDDLAAAALSLSALRTRDKLGTIRRGAAQKRPTRRTARR